jgi:acetolactate synthase I/II/III large subunit
LFAQRARLRQEGVERLALKTTQQHIRFAGRRGTHCRAAVSPQRMADRRNRVLTDGPIGTQIIGPDIDYAKLAQSMGWWASGPIGDPKDLAPALKRAVQVVKAGEPALVDVVTQPR